MTVKEILDASKEKMSKSVAVYQNEMTSLRAGRANPRLLDRIMVDYYGTPTPHLPECGHQPSEDEVFLLLLLRELHLKAFHKNQFPSLLLVAGL